jgi:hypothetical protein
MKVKNKKNPPFRCLMKPMLTPPEPADDPLEALLRAAPRTIPDDGFTDRVCAALPPRSSRVAWMRWLVLSGALLLGCLLAFPAWSRIDLILANATQEWTFEPWQALIVITALSAWGIAFDAREGEETARM